MCECVSLLCNTNSQFLNKIYFNVSCCTACLFLFSLCLCVSVFLCFEISFKNGQSRKILPIHSTSSAPMLYICYNLLPTVCY